MQTIYADVLIVLNIYINFILILATSKITRSRIADKRGIISAVYGSFYTLMILLPELDIFFNLLIKLFAGATIVLISFGFGNLKRFFINTVCFFGVNFIFGGVIFAVYIWLEPSFIHFNNTYFYVDFSLLLLIFVTAFLYTALNIFRFLFDRNLILTDDYNVTVKYKGKTAVLEGLADTGNSLVDFFSGKPVIICSRCEMSEIVDIPENAEECLKIKGFRIIPYSTVSGEGMIPVFTPDEVVITSRNTGCCKKADVMIGIRDIDKKAVFNPNIIRL